MPLWVQPWWFLVAGALAALAVGAVAQAAGAPHGLAAAVFGWAAGTSGFVLARARR